MTESGVCLCCCCVCLNVCRYMDGPAGTGNEEGMDFGDFVVCLDLPRRKVDNNDDGDGGRKDE